MIEDFIEENEISNDLFDCEYTSVDAVINEVTVFTGWTERQTENGLRTLIAYGEGHNRSAFYTDSKKLKEVVAAPGRKFPFRAIILMSFPLFIVLIHTRPFKRMVITMVKTMV